VAFIYSNNVAYFSCFALVSLGITSLFQTNYNLDRIKITSLAFTEAHAEHPTKMRFLIENKSSQPSYQLEFHIDNKNQNYHELAKNNQVITKTVVLPVIGPNETREIEFTLVFNERGYHTLPTLIANTIFPFGLFKSWKIKESNELILIYPSKKGILPLPIFGYTDVGEQTEIQITKQRGNDFYGHRSYQSNDSYRHIDWKAFARNNKLNIKLFDNEDHGAQLIAWSQTQSLNDVEKRISQLTQWINHCQKQRLDFVLMMPDWMSETGHSPTQILSCYKYLALFQKTEAPIVKNQFINFKKAYSILKGFNT